MAIRASLMRGPRAVWHAALVALGFCVGAGEAETQPIHRRSAFRLTSRFDTTVQVRSSVTSGRSHVIPAIEIVGFATALNLFDRVALGGEYRSNLASIRRNLRSRWVVEDDPYLINQFGHPYQGAMHYAFARSAGQGYWTSAAYTFVASALWEIAGETTTPSVNDQVASGIAGAFLGESMFRIAELILERGGNPPGGGRERSAAVSSPPTAFNRAAFGRRFDAVLPSRGAPYYRRLHAGAATAVRNQPGASRSAMPNEAVVEAAIEYGLPGRAGYEYRRPFDYFAVQLTGSSANGLESILTRGLLAGHGYRLGDAHHGVWGAFGSYDFIAPQLFRVSSTAVSLGATTRSSLASGVALHASATAGIGYAAVGTNRGPRDTADYQYGVAPQAMIALRTTIGDRAALDVAAREYFVSDVGASTPGAQDNIVRSDAMLTFRLYKQNAIALKLVWSRRDARYPDLGDRQQVRSTLGIFYSLLGRDRFGPTGG